MPANSSLKKWGIRALKLSHYVLTLFLLLVIFCWSINPILYYLFSTQDPLYRQQEVSEDFVLYETEFLANATASDIYRYYLLPKIKGDPLRILKKSEPFLVTDRGDAEISLISEDKDSGTAHFLVKYSGRIFKFQNIYENTPQKKALIEINATLPAKEYGYD